MSLHVFAGACSSNQFSASVRSSASSNSRSTCQTPFTTAGVAFAVSHTDQPLAVFRNSYRALAIPWLRWLLSSDNIISFLHCTQTTWHDPELADHSRIAEIAGRRITSAASRYRVFVCVSRLAESDQTSPPRTFAIRTFLRLVCSRLSHSKRTGTVPWS
jgi:hypothetical protein